MFFDTPTGPSIVVAAALLFGLGQLSFSGLFSRSSR